MIAQGIDYRERYFELLDQVSKPGRYIGGEPNITIKDPSLVKVRFALAFPDVYEVGMSHNGIRMLYHLLNRVSDVCAERVFAPWVDMGEAMRRAGVPLLSLETKRPLREFDLIGFSLQAELNYINVPYMLDLAGIPLLAEDRSDRDPLVCAGGPCTANPEPLADFIDFFVLGDGEEVVLEILDVYREARQSGRTRSQTLEVLANVEGVYVPQIHRPPTPWEIEARPGKPLTLVKRRWVEALSPDFYPTRPIVPVIDIIQDRVSVEVMRGCTQGCRFCQAGYWYRPTRELDVDDVMRLTRETLKNTGHREIGLLSLSTADYSQVEKLTRDMAQEFSRDLVSISLPSLRADMFSVSLAENVGEVKKNGFTFAPEAGSVRMRKFINKNITNEELFQAVETAYRQGWNLIKLYFMIGLPTETDADIRETVDLIREVGRIGRKFKGQKNVNASIGTFVPKSFTPFQWDRFEKLEVIKDRLEYLKATVRWPFARLKWHSPEECLIEAVLSRGDRQVGRAIRAAYELGCRFDGWDEMFNFERWQEAFNQSGVDPGRYTRDIPLNEVLPWDFLDIGVSKKFLLKERERSYQQVQTYDCKWGDCRGCGIPGNYEDIKLAAIPEQKPEENLVQILPALSATASGLSNDRTQGRAPMNAPKGFRQNREAPSTPSRAYVLHYRKIEKARFLSHLNVMQLMERALVRCEIGLRFTEGFNPRPKFSTSPAIPLGMSSQSEYLQFEAYGELPQDLVPRLNACLIEGLQVQAVLPAETRRQRNITHPLQVSYTARIDVESLNGERVQLEELQGRVADLINHLADHNKGNDFWCSSPDHERIVDLAVQSQNPFEMAFTVSVNPETGVLLRPKDFLEQVLGCPPDLARKFHLTKESVAFE
ncbi:MAG: TIGR03960 family B12-binding radical SAM protein [Acidobacteriota bacterium]